MQHKTKLKRLITFDLQIKKFRIPNFYYSIFSLIIFVLLAYVITYYTITIKPVVPRGNDPITHLELIQNLNSNFIGTLRNAYYPLFFHVIVLLISKLVNIQPIVILSYSAPYLGLLPLLAIWLMGRKLFGNFIAFTSLAFVSLTPAYLKYVFTGSYPALISNQFLIPLLIIYLFCNLLNPSSISKNYKFILFGLIAAVAAATHLMAAIEIAGYLIVMIAIVGKERLRKSLLSLGIFIATFIILYSPIIWINRNTWKNTPIAHIINVINAEDKGEESRFESYVVNDIKNTRVDPLNFLPNHYQYFGVSDSTGFMFYAFLLLSFPISVLLILFKEQKEQKIKHAFLFIISSIGFSIAISQLVPYGARIIYDLTPIMTIYIMFTWISAIENFSLLVIPLALAVLIANSNQINYKSVTWAIEKNFNPDNRTFKELTRSIRSKYPSGTTLGAVPLQGYIPFLMPEYKYYGEIRIPTKETYDLIDVIKNKKPVSDLSYPINRSPIILFTYYISKELSNALDHSFYDAVSSPLCSNRKIRFVTGESLVFVLCETK